VHDLSPEARAGDLPLAQQQLVEIAKAMSFDPRVLILDEPTSALGRTDVERLLRVVRRLQHDRGCAIVFISHRMDEIAAVTDQVTILRSGRRVGGMARAEFCPDRALELMLGDTPAHLERLRADPAAGAPLLQVRGLRLAGRLGGLDLDVRAGEVVGLAGLEGQGQKEALFALFGLFRHGLGGSVTVEGRDVRARTPRQAIASSFALIPDDRKTMGGLLGLGVKQNISLAVLERLCRLFVIDSRRERRLVEDLVGRLQIKCGSIEAPLSSLSGGNQQKVVAAKWLARGARIFLFCDPTRGVDAGAREVLYATIHDLAKSGCAILVYSTDINEFSVLCSRVLVLRGGRISGSLERAAITEENILALSFREAGQRQEAA